MVRLINKDDVISSYIGVGIRLKKYGFVERDGYFSLQKLMKRETTGATKQIEYQY